MVCTSCVVPGDVSNTVSTDCCVSLEQLMFPAENFFVDFGVLGLRCCDDGRVLGFGSCDDGRDVFSSEIFQQGVFAAARGWLVCLLPSWWTSAWTKKEWALFHRPSTCCPTILTSLLSLHAQVTARLEASGGELRVLFLGWERMHGRMLVTRLVMDKIQGWGGGREGGSRAPRREGVGVS